MSLKQTFQVVRYNTVTYVTVLHTVLSCRLLLFLTLAERVRQPTASYIDCAKSQRCPSYGTSNCELVS